MDSIHFLIPLLLFVSYSKCENKYSKEANVENKRTFYEPAGDIRTLEKPFRMAKLNLLWKKAQLRLTEGKLRSLFSELKIHDKEELTWKKIASEGKDKDGLQEADLRKKLTGIMSTYDLLEHFKAVNDPEQHKHHKPLTGQKSDTHLNKSLFKDKKLNKLWEKAEVAGFTTEELFALREEFTHHQDKLDQYYSLISDMDSNDDAHLNSVDEKIEHFNQIEYGEELNRNTKKDFEAKVNALKTKNRDIRDGFDKLERLTASGPRNQDFVEPKVQGLWRLATSSNFTVDELESLKVELLHYEKRLLKLRHLQAEAALSDHKKAAGDKVHLADFVDDSIRKQAKKVERLHFEIKTKIMGRHSEL
ncbi:hypothetical protein LSTR_LSTR008397 [Laodelphax striatellus]|uniref:Alpha-2-macroglobulin RAP C-terminal domain-containing protein n=1 Tax=Laodelphax striatellus TaxID=195883 RepID=A0A482XYJ2_LAOST|nr:hypothetical protein LSTR_LSTR008397 [Laodelphax striatellus]